MAATSKPRRVLGCAVALALTLALPASALANGDPPSDVLPTQDVYLPITPSASEGIARALLELTRRTREDGWPIKVAIIATAADLGDASMLINRPQDYSNFLAAEIKDPRLLVVTPVGFGGQKLGRGVDALAEIAPVAPGNDRLERQALTAVAQLAAADGHRVPVPAIDTSELGKRPYRRTLTQHQGSPSGASAPGRSTSGGGGASVLVYAAPLAIVVLLLGAGLVRDRRRRADVEPGAPE